MEKMNDLKDLLKHEIQDLYSAEEQIIAALPAMIDKARNADLKKSLQEHLRVTRQQLSRLEQVQTQVGNGMENNSENKGLLSRLFKSRQLCRGMQGLIEEGNKVMGEDMHPDVLDAAIIACAQKIEHYEICGYGTARTFARELGLEKAAQLLEQTLSEEYQADDLLTRLAVTRINKEAESAAARGRSATQGGGRGTGRRSTAGEKLRREEPEMEMVANRTRSTASRPASATSRGGAAPRTNEGARTGTAANRATAGTKRNTAAGRSETKSTRGTGRAGGSGRGNDTARSRSRGR